MTAGMKAVNYTRNSMSRRNVAERETDVLDSSSAFLDESRRFGPRKFNS